ncbi:MAG TPA: oxaloacetate decarboxylase [Bacteroidales bacterium]|nr:oxaloacetate decarboxylase [Bacteroidales bacterium]
MKKEIKFSLIYRDMWQSSGKYVPRVDQLKKIAPVIVEMGCFSRIETNGGAFEQVNLLYGENPNTAVREWTKPFNEAGIQTHMLERALNGIRMFPVPADVRKLMYKVKKAQGVDIARSFCGLNDHRNLELSIKYAKEAGMISQAALSITHSEVHTVPYFMSVVDKAIEYGADEICLKDMAGVGRPATLGKLVRAIKEKYPKTIVQYHGHSGPGFSVSSMMEVARAGADYLDVAMEPLSWGMVHPDVITIQEMLKDEGFLVPEINMNAYMEARALTQSFIDDFLGYFIDPKNRFVSSLLIGSGLPGGMMGSLMADLKGVHNVINSVLVANGEHELSEDDLLVKLFDEVKFIWPKLGYPPLVTPFSQYVKNVALLNILQLVKGEERYSMMDNNTWDMILGKSGTLPGTLAPEIIALAKNSGKEFYTGVPQDAYPDVLEKYRKEMIENNWDFGRDNEELFEFAMHEAQYRDYKSGAAKTRFEEEIENAKNQNSEKKSFFKMKEKQSPNRSAYPKEKANESEAIAAFLLYSLNYKPKSVIEHSNPENNVWNTIGFWRNILNVVVRYNSKDIEISYACSKNGNYEIQIGGEIINAKIEYLNEGEIDISVNGKKLFASVSAEKDGSFKVLINGQEFLMSRNDMLFEKSDLEDSETGIVSAAANNLYSPIPGKIFKLNVKEGDKVKKGDVVIVVDAMKMENNLVAKKDSVVKKIHVNLNQMVTGNFLLVELEDIA